jgi:hypothetical protein
VVRFLCVREFEKCPIRGSHLSSLKLTLNARRILACPKVTSLKENHVKNVYRSKKRQEVTLAILGFNEQTRLVGSVHDRRLGLMGLCFYCGGLSIILWSLGQALIKQDLLAFLLDMSALCLLLLYVFMRTLHRFQALAYRRFKSFLSRLIVTFVVAAVIAKTLPMAMHARIAFAWPSMLFSTLRLVFCLASLPVTFRILGEFSRFQMGKRLNTLLGRTV